MSSGNGEAVCVRACTFVSAYRHDDIDDQQDDLKEPPKAVEAGELAHFFWLMQRTDNEE